eukprot:jgi/Mesen1/7396/ME000388S06615
MEVEVKLKLADAVQHGRVAELLTGHHEATYMQQNVFFDGTGQELSSKRVVLRLRFYDEDARCVVTLKGKSVMADGIGRSTEEEEEIDPAIGRACILNPSKLASVDSPLLNSLEARYGCKDFVCLGGFRNIRMVHAWEGHKLELDETQAGQPPACPLWALSLVGPDWASPRSAQVGRP